MDALKHYAIFAFGLIMGIFLSASLSLGLGLDRALERRELVMQCVTDLGWEFADESADASTQAWQSVDWCERFVEGEIEAPP